MDFITEAIARAIEQGPRTMRDSQRSKVYAAEKAAYPDGHGPHPGPLSIAECEKLANAMVEYARRVGIVGTWRRHPIRVADGRGCRKASAGGSTITLPRWARSVHVVAHEVAHCITPEEPAHGPHWVARFLRLIERFDGFEARERLGVEMRNRNVKTRP